MRQSNEPKKSSKRKLILRKESIRALDGVNLLLVAGGGVTQDGCEPSPNAPH